MCVNSQSFMNKDFLIMRNLEKRLPKKKTFHELITRYNGLQDNVTSITLELSLFLFFISTWTWCL